MYKREEMGYSNPMWTIELDFVKDDDATPTPAYVDHWCETFAPTTRALVLTESGPSGHPVVAITAPSFADLLEALRVYAGDSDVALDLATYAYDLA